MFGTIVWAILAVLLGIFIFRVGFMMLRSLGHAAPRAAARR